MWQMYLNYHKRMRILPLKKRINRDKCSFMSKQPMFGVFAIDEILCYRWTPFVGSRTICHPNHRQYHQLQTTLAWVLDELIGTKKRKLIATYIKHLTQKCAKFSPTCQEGIFSNFLCASYSFLCKNRIIWSVIVSFGKETLESGHLKV